MSGMRMVCAAALVLLAVPVASAFAETSSPPSCGAVNFRPVMGSPNDGTQDAGLYRSRFGTIVLRAEASGGAAKNYYVEVNGKRPPALTGALPAAVTPCLNSKHVKTPAPSAGASCLGQRFRVVLNNVAGAKYVMLFGLDGETWKMCSASKM